MGNRPTERDALRVTEILHSRYGRAIVDRETFNRAYDFYMSGSFLERNSEYGIQFNEDVWQNYAKKYNLAQNVEINQRKRETERFQKVAVQEEIIKAGIAPEFAKPKEVKKLKAKFDKFKFHGKQKGAIVKSRRIRTRAGIRYIDMKGRYVSKPQRAR